MSSPKTRGRPKEIFQINFNEELRHQLQVMSLKQLFKLPLSLLIIIPMESFISSDNESNSTSLFCFFGKIIRKVTQKKIAEDEIKYQHIDEWSKATNASAIQTFENSHPIEKSFIFGLAGGRALIDVGFCGKFVDSLRKIVNPKNISDLGVRDSFLMAIITRSREAYNLMARSSGSSPMYPTIRRYFNESLSFFHPDRPNQNKLVCFDNEQTTTYKSRIGGEKSSTKANISLCTAVLNVYDNENLFIQNNPLYSPKVWLYDGIKNENIRSLGVEKTNNRTIYDENVEMFWDNILKEEFSNCFMIEGHIEDDISVTIKERNQT